MTRFKLIEESFYQLFKYRITEYFITMVISNGGILRETYQSRDSDASDREYTVSLANNSAYIASVYKTDIESILFSSSFFLLFLLSSFSLFGEGKLIALTYMIRNTFLPVPVGARERERVASNKNLFLWPILFLAA